MVPGTTSCRATAPLVMMMMMMMMAATETAAVPKGSKTVQLLLDPSALVPSRIFRPLQNVSISPWTYNTSSDSSLLMPALSEARCLLRGCLNLEGKEDLSLESRPIMHQVLVLRRVRAAGAGHSYHYHLESRLIAVGCTCVKPVVQVQQ
ncbi:Interleukin-17F [Oryzias melastigma]|uniref:Interleukin-17F n=1 Tax=Oryzias melastigma TaxID=30732 RepID=A0A834FI79_ORYME|nr:Interleukin-17F [Oryzias melastigma]